MDNIGKRLSSVRKAKGLSQRQLAKLSGVTNSTISLVEQDKISPTISSLKKVLSGIPMTMAEFFTWDSGDNNNTNYVFYKQNQPNIGHGSIGYYLIGSEAKNRSMEVLREVMKKGADTGAEMIKHEGQEAGVVVSGKLELTVDNMVHVLEPGDGYYFESSLPHRFRNIGDDDVIIISANSPPTF